MDKNHETDFDLVWTEDDTIDGGYCVNCEHGLQTKEYGMHHFNTFCPNEDCLRYGLDTVVFMLKDE